EGPSPTLAGRGVRKGQVMGRKTAQVKPRKRFPRFRRYLLYGILVAAAVGGYLLFPQVQASLPWRKAQQALDQNDLAAGQTHLERCWEVWPASAETHFLLARTCRRANDLDGARDHLSEAQRLDWDPELIELEYLLMQAQSGIVQPVEQN